MFGVFQAADGSLAAACIIRDLLLSPGTATGQIAYKSLKVSHGADITPIYKVNLPEYDLLFFTRCRIIDLYHTSSKGN